MDRLMFLGVGMLLGALIVSGRHKRQLLEAEILSKRNSTAA